MTAPIIVTDGLTKKFGDEVSVDNLSFEIQSGEIFALIGPSGSGKTSTVRLLIGYYEPNSGSVRVFGKSPAALTDKERKKIGYMPQLFTLYPDLTIWENLNFVASLYGMGPFRRKALNKLLDLVELRPHRKKSASKISGGMQRRLSMAAAMVHNPEVLFLDEPTAGIDPVLRKKFWDHFHLMKEDGRTFIVTTQYVSEASYCDRIAVLIKGSIVCIDTPDGLRRRAFGGEIVDLSLITSDLNLLTKMERLPFVKGPVQPLGGSVLRVIVDDASTAIPSLLEFLRAENVEVKSTEQYHPPFDDVFVHLVKSQEDL